MKVVLKLLITIGMIAIVKSQDPKCTFETDSDGLLTCKLTGGGISPDDIDAEIAGTPAGGKTFDDVERLYSLEFTSTDMIYSIFKKFKNLKKLELTKGMVEKLEQGMLYNCSKLEKLTINEGIIKTIEANTFERCPELTEIDLGSNNITGLLSGAFNGLSKLKTLKFNSNQLSNIQATVFNVSTLEYLDLSKNQLRLTNRTIFSNNNELLSLNMAENGISFIIKEHFNGLNKLTTLDFSKNGLNAAEETALDFLKELKVAKFKNNICIDIDYTDYSQSNYADDFAICIKNFNGAPILILSNLLLIVPIVLKFVY